MAQIDLERQSGGSSWGWLAGLVLLALVGWGAWALTDTDDDMAVVESADPAETAPAATPYATDTMQAEAPATAESATLAMILERPDRYVDQTFPGAEVDVGSVPTDRGFWIEDDGERLFAIIIDEPREEPKDINPGATLRIDDGTLRDPAYLSEVPGVPLDDDTRMMAQNQEIFLVVDERYIEIVESADMGA